MDLGAGAGWAWDWEFAIQLVKDDDSSKGDEVMMVGKALARIFPEGYVVKSLIKMFPKYKQRSSPEAKWWL